MDMKNTVILLIFLISILGLLLGVYCTDDSATATDHHNNFERIYENANSILTITLEKKENNNINDNFT